MELHTIQQLASKKCVPCEGGVEKLSAEQAQAQLAALPGWRLTHDGMRIRKDWQARNFMAGISFLQNVARVAEQEGHHPDLHLDDYRHVWIEIWTHAIGGLSQNDFILAAKIEQSPIELKRT